MAHMLLKLRSGLRAPGTLGVGIEPCAWPGFRSHVGRGCIEIYDVCMGRDI